VLQRAFVKFHSQRSHAVAVAVVALLFTASLIHAQWRRGSGPGMRGSGSGMRGGRGAGAQRAADRSEYPSWKNEPGFEYDVFTFARVQYDSYGGRGGGQHWSNDYPDCDLNFSYRLKQLTSFEVDPQGTVVRLTDPRLPDFPFLYMSNPGYPSLGDDEITALRRHLLNGGFLMADDFWAAQEWRNVRQLMRQVFPDREPRELALDHEIFHIVYDLKELPRVPSIFANWREGDTFERWHGDAEGDEAPHFWGIYDDKGRMMALLCHNNDIGDGWEREGEEKEYFHRYSEKFSYPLGINIVTYVMTH
jgi:hypothetical protein